MGARILQNVQELRLWGLHYKVFLIDQQLTELGHHFLKSAAINYFVFCSLCINTAEYGYRGKHTTTDNVA